MKKSVLYMDQNGVEELKLHIAVLRKKMENAKRFNGDIAGENYAEYEEALREIGIIASELTERLDDLKRVVIVERHSDDNLIDIGDVVIVDIAATGEVPEESTFKLVAGIGNLRAEIPEVSINSPLGNSIYRKSVGTECTYDVNGCTMNVLIKTKVVLEQTEDEPTLK